MARAIRGVWALPPGVDFAAELLRGLDRRLDPADPLAVARVEIWVNTQRARRALLAAGGAGEVRMMPRIRVLDDMAAEISDLPPLLPPLRLKLELARAVRALLDAAPDTAGRTAAWPMAESLAALLSEMRFEGVPFPRLVGLEAPDMAGHWQRALAFLRVLEPVLEDTAGPVDPDRRLMLAMAAKAAAWQVSPPRHPVLVAGSTGSRRATAEFMAAVTALPQGAVILPGVDADLPGDLWQDLPDDHPQAGIARVADRLGVDPAGLKGWTDATPPAPERARLMSLALRPAPVTGAWRKEGPALKPTLAGIAEQITLIEAPSPQAEADAIALCLREALEHGLRAALITPDRALTRRVAAALSRWTITPDDSAGRPLDLTPPGTFLRLVAEIMAGQHDAVRLLALMKHPLTASGPEARGPHLGRVARLETVLRAEAGPRVTPALLAATEGVDAAWLAPLFEAHPDHMLSDIVARHIAMAEHIAAGPEGAPHQLWQEAAGEEAQRLMEELTSAAPHGGALGLRDYPPLIRGILAGATVPEAAFAPDPRIAIWGPLEARTQTADLVILGGLNEGTWPRLPDPDPWLGREMRSALGLPLPERRIGLSAHDVQQAGNAKRVVLSRAIRDGEAPTVPARWLLRLTNLMQGLDGPMAAMRAKGTRLVDMAARLDGRESAPSATRPAPVPPRDSVPDQLSVTGVERLARDPYQIYARHVLRLKPLRPLRREADALERGTVLHAVLKTFIDRTAETLPENAAEILRSTAAEVIGAEVPWPAAGTLWTALFDRIAERFAAEEAERRHLAQPFAREVEGALTLPFAPPFTLIAKADRIDRAPDGRLYIYDYKSGKPPTGNKLTHYKQLSLEGLIAQDGGFQGVPAGKIAALTLLGLKDGETKNLEDAKALDRVAEELALLIGAYRDGAGFAARRRPDLLGDWPGDYDHLARLGEWLDGDDAVEVRL